LTQKFAYFLFVHGTVLNKTWSTNQYVPYLWHILGGIMAVRVKTGI